MKKFIISAAALLIAVISSADTIDRQQARTIAQRWLGTEVTEASYGSDAFYIFNGNSGGWIIVSAEDAATPVLGYSDTGRINPERLPVNFKAWIGGYEREILEARAERLEASMEVKALWKTAGYKTKSAAGKVLSTPLWGQESPYNDLCPKVTEGGKTYTAVTGCVATAMSEVIRYHQWPEHGTGTLEGYTYQSDYKKTVTIEGYSIDSHNYDYSLMPFEYKGSENSAQKAAVAQLMHDCGVMVYANYNYGTGTGAFTEEVVNALVTHMSYSASAQLVYRQAYSDAEWTRLIEKEIDEDRPIIYGGEDPSKGGHQFVCDGYDTRDYIRINWGWDGDNNGYFTLTLKIPGMYTFSDTQSMIINLQPDREGDDITVAGPLIYEGADSKSTGLSVQSGSILSKQFTLSAKAISNVNYYVDYTGALKAALLDWRGSVKEFISEEFEFDLPAYNLAQLTDISCKIKGDVIFGDRVVLFYKTSTGAWEMIHGRESLDYSQSQSNPKRVFLNESIPAVDAAYILVPENAKAGDTYFFELVPGSSQVTSVNWYYDGEYQSGISANLTAGTHTVKASVSYASGLKETISATIVVK